MATNDHIWTTKDFEKYRISVAPMASIKDFFGIDTLPQPVFAEPVFSEILTLTNPNDTETALPWRIISDLKVLHTDPQSTSIDLVSLVAIHLLQLIDYEGPKGHLTYLSGKVPGDNGILSTGPCIMDSETSAHLLFVEGGKKQYQEGVQSREPIEHLITDAIAAFQSNNKRFMQKNKRPLDIAIIPGIIFNGSLPTFYLIPVTQELINAMDEKREPVEETKVLAYTPDISEGQRSEGFWPTENRLFILQHFEAFKAFVQVPEGLKSKE